MASQNDLTAERAAIQSFYYCLYAGVEGGEFQERYEQEDIGKIVALVHKTRQDALREAANKVRDRAVLLAPNSKRWELNMVTKAKSDVAHDLADELDRLASEGG